MALVLFFYIYVIYHQEIAMLGSEVVNGTQELASVSVTYQGYLLAIELGNVIS